MHKIIFVIHTILVLISIPGCKIQSIREGESDIHKRFEKTFKNSKSSKSAVLLIHSDALNLHIKDSAGYIQNGKEKMRTSLDQPYHIASIGKLFTTTLIYQLVEENRIKLSDSISDYLEERVLKGLYFFEGKDYTKNVTIENLLAHTSGAEDYFEGGNESILHQIITSPDKFWTPEDILEFSRTNLKPIAPPGKKFHYSDTGFILLGLLIEKITEKSFEQNLRERIFSPLGMKHTYMHLRDTIPQGSLSISPMILNSKDITNFVSVSADWAGGGIISTTEDLLLFYRGINEKKLLKNHRIEDWLGNELFHDGIYYGKGIMTVKYGDMMFLMPETPDLYGHSGLLSTLLFYSPEYDTYIVSNFGSTEDISLSFEMMFHIMRVLKDIKELKKP
ncbi:MAG: beta-lactamase family protein [Leptospiraceae bacterium]|nr:beta-lactamase family protein [Leptospiraceae bacterium]MCP5510314.1 beta-lactamase family protein [Leptospiraceae bacterium]